MGVVKWLCQFMQKQPLLEPCRLKASKNRCFLSKRTFREGDEAMKESRSPFHTAAQRSRL